MILQVAFALPLRRVFDYQCPSQLVEFSSSLIGRRVLVSFGFKKQVGLICGVLEYSSTPADKLKPIDKLLDDDAILTADQLELAQWMSRRYMCSYGEALFAFLPPGKNKKKNIDESEPEPFLDAHHHEIHEKNPHLTEEQKTATEKIHDAIYQHSSAEFLLYGVAAAGKTEVYMAAIRDVLQQGKSILYLVPEISLAVQTVESLKHRFGEAAVVFWRSDITAGERLELWNRIRRGQAPIVVGPRSAILLSIPQLGLIVVDEEHDSAYKEDRKPRFHVRDVARERARRSQSVLIYGSATPSLELFHQAKLGTVQLLTLAHRAVVSSTPHLQLVDLTQKKWKGLISSTLETKIQTTLKNHEQVILYLNRRGFHRYLRCSSCGWAFRCETCGVTLVEHKGKQFTCHYCTRTFAPPAACPDCHKKDLFSGGYGTERIEEELKEKFPWAKVLRWDRDALTKKKILSTLFQEFQKGAYDILIGTQLVAHGFNFPNVTLVGILDADGPLHVPDFRAAERTFQSVIQVAGRAGRALVTGDVIIQTKHPTHPAIQAALTMDMLSFSEQELRFRDELRYPPFSHLIRLIAVDKKGHTGDVILTSLADLLSEQLSGVGILGPNPMKKKRAGKNQWQVLLKIPERQFETCLDLIPQMIEQHKWPVIIDPDPET